MCSFWDGTAHQAQITPNFAIFETLFSQPTMSIAQLTDLSIFFHPIKQHMSSMPIKEAVPPFEPAESRGGNVNCIKTFSLTESAGPEKNKRQIPARTFSSFPGVPSGGQLWPRACRVFIRIRPNSHSSRVDSPRGPLKEGNSEQNLANAKMHQADSVSEVGGLVRAKALDILRRARVILKGAHRRTPRLGDLH